MTDATLPTTAVLYARVSSRKQVSKGDGIQSQLSVCRQFAQTKNLKVLESFTDHVSGNVRNRPGMKAMLAFLRKRRKDGTVVIIDHPSRLARDIVVHVGLRNDIRSAGGVLVTPMLEFNDDPDNRFVEGINALQSAHQRETNAIQTKSRMRSRVMNGYYVFYCPVGYEYRAVKGRGKMLFRKEPEASIIAEALEGFATGRFQTKVEVRRFLEAQPDYPKDRQRRILDQRVIDILTRPTYCGYVEAPSWGVGLTKGHHEALISFETYQAIQRRMKERAVAPARKNIALDFVLRGFTDCSCGSPLSACWSTARNGTKHPYYFCFNRLCDSYKRLIRREQIEGEFEALLHEMQPSRELFGLAAALFRDLWDDRLGSAKAREASLESEIAKTEKAVAQFLDRIVEAETRRSSKPMRSGSPILRHHKSATRKRSRIAGVPPRASISHFEPPWPSSQVLVICGIQMTWPIAGRC